MSKPNKIELSSWPTPLEPQPRLAQALGLRPDDLWIKRDDLTGLAGGGNKIRKLEYTCAEAIRNGAKTLVTVGAAQSNHARLTAAAAARLGLNVVLVLAGHPPTTYTGNIALNGLLGAQLIWAGEVNDIELEECAKKEVFRLENEGIITAFIPFGGSNRLASYGYVNCGEEIKEQAPDFSHIFTAVGSGSTMAGLVHSLGATYVQGVNAGAVANPAERVKGLLTEISGKNFSDSLNIDLDQVGAGYSFLTEPVKEALHLVAIHSGIILDPIYTGRAFAGLIAAIRDGSVKSGEQTIFLHSGGLPGFFGNPDVLDFSKY